LSSAARRVLVDEDLPPRLAVALAAELGEAMRCSSVRDEGWRGLKNGALLARLNLATVVVTRPLHCAAVFARVTAIAEAVRAVPPGASIEISPS